MKATVLLVTYNHSAYIRQAVESVLAQEADFEWEVLITEDCSTDGTREIVQEYADRHPERIRLLLSKLNQNDNEVVSRGIDAARGTYLALLDGDDYWLGPRKLELQGKEEQARAIRDTFLQARPVPWTPWSRQLIEDLAPKALDRSNPSAKQKQVLLDYALWHGQQAWVEQLARANFQAARPR